MSKLIIPLACVVALGVVALCWQVGARSRHDPADNPDSHAAAGRFFAAARNSSAPQAAASEDGIEVYYSPNGGCSAAIMHEIGEAKQNIWVQAAQFTSPSIAKALVVAHDRG